jgi:hypothetical protein
LGTYDVDVDEGDMSAAARFLDGTPVPVANPRLVRPPSRILTIKTASVHAILQPTCDCGACCHYNKGKS